MYKVYGDYISGNCYKVKLMLNLLGSEYEWVPVNILNGETQTAAFLEKNPNGKIPVLELDDGTCLWESNAILNFLADGSRYLPSEPRLRTQVLQWQFFEQYSHEPSVAVARFIQFYWACLPNAWSNTAPCRSPAIGRWRSWSSSFIARRFWSGTISPSPILPCMPTPMWRTSVVLTWSPTRAFAAG